MYTDAYISPNIDYVISIDESGSPDLKQPLKYKHTGQCIQDSDKHFTVTACSISMENFTIARDMVMALKHKYWVNALYTYKGTEKRVCFHSREIRGRREAFNPNLIDYDSFVVDLSQLIRDVPITLYASHIDKVRHVIQYAYPVSPYDLCMNFVLERIILTIGSAKTCVTILESRGAKEDKILLKQIINLIDHGNRYYSSSFFSPIKGVYFNPKWCHLKNDQMSYWELELADICAYPIQKYFVYGTQDKAFKTLLPKIHCYPSISGKGLKSFP